MLGIVEDTENGHQKYESALSEYAKVHVGDDSRGVQRLPRIWSVARSLMKQTEDYNVGKSLVRATDTLLREHLDLRLEDELCIGVLGFGKIGSSIARHLQQQNIGTVYVCDIKPHIAIRAASQDFIICDKEQMLQKVSIIFAATGNKCLTFQDLRRVQADMLIVSSCTSADDELDVHDGLTDAARMTVNPAATLVATTAAYTQWTVVRDEGRPLRVFLLCDGNAPNFFCSAILGEYIRAVQAAMMVCAIKLRTPVEALKSEAAASNSASALLLPARVSTQTSTGSSDLSVPDQPKLLVLQEEDERMISSSWLHAFTVVKSKLITNLQPPSEIEAFSAFDGVDMSLAPSVDALFQKLLRSAHESVQLMVTGPDGSCKPELASHLVMDPRVWQRYDLIWWLDLRENAVMGTLLQLARRLERPTIFDSLEALQRDVLTHLVSTENFQHVLLICDNVEGCAPAVESNEAVAMDTSTAASSSSSSAPLVASNSAPLMVGDNLCCHPLLRMLSDLLATKNRKQRRMHVLALYNEPSNNLPALDKEQVYVNRWMSSADSCNCLWLLYSMPPLTLDNVQRLWDSNLIAQDSTVAGFVEHWKRDGRRLTIYLAQQLVKHCGGASQPAWSYALDNTIPNVLTALVREAFLMLTPGAQSLAGVLCWLNFNSLSTSVIHDAAHYKYGASSQRVKKRSLSSAGVQLVEWFVLRRNRLASEERFSPIGRRGSTLDSHVYSMASAFAAELRLHESSQDHFSNAVALTVRYFDYDYHRGDRAQYTSNPQYLHYLDHALAIAGVSTVGRVSLSAPSFSSDNDESRTCLLWIQVLCRLAIYYVNEHRDYARARAFAVLAKTRVSSVNSTTTTQMLSISSRDRFAATLYALGAIAQLYEAICIDLLAPPGNAHVPRTLELVDAAQKQLERSCNVDAISAEALEAAVFKVECIIMRLKLQLCLTENEEALETDFAAMKAACALNSNAEMKDDAAHSGGARGSFLPVRTQALSQQLEGRVHLRRMRTSEAAVQFGLAQRALESLFGTDQHPDVARILYLKARAIVLVPAGQSILKQDLNSAHALCVRALRVQRSTLPEHHRNALETIGLTQDIERKLAEASVGDAAMMRADSAASVTSVAPGLSTALFADPPVEPEATTPFSPSASPAPVPVSDSAASGSAAAAPAAAAAQAVKRRAITVLEAEDPKVQKVAAGTASSATPPAAQDLSEN